jgi:hypothetical protein
MNTKGRKCILYLPNAAINTASYMMPAETSVVLRMVASQGREMVAVLISFLFGQMKP